MKTNVDKEGKGVYLVKFDTKNIISELLVCQIPNSLQIKL